MSVQKVRIILAVMREKYAQQYTIRKKYIQKKNIQSKHEINM